MSLAVGLLDRLVFTLGVLILMQLPHFVDQYSHRLGGYQRGVQQQLAQFQAIADANFSGALDALVADFTASTSPAVAATGHQVAAARNRAAQLAQGVRILETRSLPRKLVYLATDLEPVIARDSLRTFKPGIPMTLAAAVCGLAGGIAASLLFHGSLWGVRRLFRMFGLGVRKVWS